MNVANTSQSTVLIVHRSCEACVPASSDMQRNLFWNTDRKGLQSSVRLWRRPYYRGRDCINSSFSETKQAVRNIEVSLINVAVRKEVILRSTSCITSVHKRYILLVEKGYRSRHFLYFEHDRKGAYYLPEIPYVEEYVEEPFSTSCWGNFTLTKWCKLMKITDYVDWTSGLFKNFAIYLRMRANIAALEDWVLLSWRLARVEKRFRFCVKKSLTMFT